MDSLIQSLQLYYNITDDKDDFLSIVKEHYGKDIYDLLNYNIRLEDYAHKL